ncbi:MAG: site-specific tyrosine recombinase XerD [Bacteroidales bacterium]|nr:site-specific tyrosine recombinase XerD [Bacteroidales bacterium]
MERKSDNVLKAERNPLIKSFRDYLRLEKSLSKNSILAYNSDIVKFFLFLNPDGEEKKKLDEVTLDDLQEFMASLYDKNVDARSQARIVSGLKAFYDFLLFEGKIEEAPTQLLDGPKLGMHLPDVLSIPEIEEIIGAIDLSSEEGHRNKAIIEVLYGCGLRVSELVNLTISHLHFNEEIISVIGKGDKERIVPIGQTAQKAIGLYMEDRNRITPKKGCEDILFLNRRGGKLSREMIFIIIKKLAAAAGITKNVSPHTFRHSFASHLVDGGADLRAVQEMLGHESITTTEIYTHLNKDYIRETMQLFHPRYK